MGYAEDGMMTVKARIYDRIAALEAGLDGLTEWEIVERVDEVRRMAHDHGMSALEDMAHGCVAVMAWTPGAAAIRPWIEALREALGCEALDAGSVRAWLAALGMRSAH